jgi:hypothetical protein
VVNLAALVYRAQPVEDFLRERKLRAVFLHAELTANDPGQGLDDTFGYRLSIRFPRAPSGESKIRWDETRDVA